MHQRNLELERARTTVKRKASEAPDQKPNKIACGVAFQFPSLSYLNIKSLTKSYLRVRHAAQPTLPTVLPDVFSSLDNFNFDSLACLELLQNDPVHQIVMLGSSNGLRHLSAAEHILCDGTFKYCTKFFLQLYTFHAFEANEVYVPCVFFS